MFRLRFYQRLALSLVAVFTLLLGAFLWSSNYFHQISKSEAEQRLHLGLAEHLVADNPLLKTGVYNYEALKNLFHTLMILGPAFEFYYLDENGKILTYSADAGKVKRPQVDLQPIRQLIAAPDALPVLGDDPRNPEGQKIFSAAPVLVDNQVQGYLYVIIGGEIYDSVFNALQSNQSLRDVSLIIIASLIFLMVALLMLFHYFTAPLRQLTAEVEQAKASNFVVSKGQSTLETGVPRWRSDSESEVQRLGCAFTDMLKQIEQQMTQLRQLDEQRRVLLADLSHDLRTPLANLQGYVETLALKSDRLSEEEKTRFLEVTLKNARNLKHLVDQIFELAYLEGGQVTLHQEAFPLGELLHDIAAKFALKASQKSIELSVLPQHFDFHVFADIGKLERVLTNLLENAIRHTPEGGKVELVASQASGKVRIDIRDSGVGISEKEIAFIFDARYQAQNSEQDNSLHAGLGLAISQKLTALFDSDLKVHSELGKGTCFSFELQQAKTLSS